MMTRKTNTTRVGRCPKNDVDAISWGAADYGGTSSCPKIENGTKVKAQVSLLAVPSPVGSRAHFLFFHFVAQCLRGFQFGRQLAPRRRQVRERPFQPWLLGGGGE